MYDTTFVGGERARRLGSDSFLELLEELDRSIQELKSLAQGAQLLLLI